MQVQPSEAAKSLWMTVLGRGMIYRIFGQEGPPSEMHSVQSLG
jgi:hypothetical protein